MSPFFRWRKLNRIRITSVLLFPANHSTAPPKIERDAEPLPYLARIDSSRRERFRPAALLAAPANAANPDADDARPADFGNEFFETTLAHVLVFAIFLTISKKKTLSLFPLRSHDDR